MHRAWKQAGEAGAQRDRHVYRRGRWHRFFKNKTNENGRRLFTLRSVTAKNAEKVHKKTGVGPQCILGFSRRKNKNAAGRPRSSRSRNADTPTPTEHRMPQAALPHVFDQEIACRQDPQGRGRCSAHGAAAAHAACGTNG
jgi:hypothetical protein